jgi:hypothetical protein
VAAFASVAYGDRCFRRQMCREGASTDDARGGKRTIWALGHDRVSRIVDAVRDMNDWECVRKSGQSPCKDWI